MSAANGDAFTLEKIAQHARAREGALQMQFVNAPHQRQVFGRHGARSVINRTPAEIQNLRLARDRQIVGGLDHRFALNRPALPSAPDKKSFSSASSPILAWSAFKSTAGAAASFLSRPKTPGRPVEKLTAPLRDLVRMDIELLRQFGQRLLPLDRGQGYFRLERRRVVPASSLCHLRS